MFNPASGVAMARAAADSADEYAAQAGQAWGDFRGGAVGLAGLAGGAFGANAGAALCAGGMDAYLNPIEPTPATAASATWGSRATTPTRRPRPSPPAA